MKYRQGGVIVSYFNIVAQTNENTVVTEYESVTKRSDAYQSEAELEREFIRLLTEQGYEYLHIHTEAELIANLRKKLEEVNGYTFTDSEWKRFFAEALANSNEGIAEKTRKIQEDHVQVLRRDDGTSKNIRLIDKDNIHNNKLQVLNQYVIGTAEGAKHDNRYDVTVLVNGLPLVHIELKRRGVPIREAFNQINRYQRDSFWAGSGLYEYVQIFVIKKSGSKEPFDRSKMLSGILKACQKRPLNGEEIAAEIENELQNNMVHEITSRDLGEMIMQKLRARDDVAYVRFASVYREFKDLDTFLAELRELKSGNDQN
jgi:type I restriction enzyme R subunit